MNDLALPPRPRNITDLARMAGVTPSTVSRALANKSIVNLATRERIQKLAADHGFHLNKMARGLRTQKTGIIGVVVPMGHERRQHLSDPFFMGLLAHLADCLTENGYDIMLSRVIPDAADWLDRITRSGMLDGVLLIGQSDQFDTIERVADRYQPIVTWGSMTSGQRHCAVGVDNRMGGRLIGEHLVARGCRRIAFLGEARTPELIERYSGLCEAAAAAALAPPLQLDAHLATDVMSFEISAHIDAVGDRIDAIACASDLLAFHTIRILDERGISVPGKLPVTGFDDLPLAKQTSPALTTIRQDLALGARHMVDALLGRIAGKDIASVQMIPQLIERNSA